MSKVDNMVTKLQCLLEDERQAILEGNFEKLPKIASKRSTFINDIKEIQSFAKQDLQRLKVRIIRNIDLFESALSGIQAASRRLEEIRKVRVELDVYDKSGKRSLGSFEESKNIEKRV